MNEVSKDPARKEVKTKTGLRLWGYKTRRELASESIIDALTGLLNRKGWDQKIVDVKGASFITIDLDNLKAINDLRGHAEGDKMLINFAKILRATVRASDIAARVGGDEFAICLPRTTLMEAENLKDRLLEATGDIGISIGVGENFSDSDEEMYKMKEEHKNV